MTRIGNILVQAIDEYGVVIVDEASGGEVFIPIVHLAKVHEALGYFVRLFASREGE